MLKHRTGDGIGQEFRDQIRPAKNPIACRSTDLTTDRLISFWWKCFVRYCYIWIKYNLCENDSNL